MEVAGLVLGALPLAIKAFQTYRTILSTMKNTKHELESMIRDLKTEQIILQNTCAILLRGIAPDSEILDMIDNPYGDAWKKYNDEVRLRMGNSERLFQERVEEMMEATAELQDKLALDCQGKARLTDHASIFVELKCKTSFTLRKDKYASILTRLHKGNAILKDLVDQNLHLGSFTKSLSQAKATRLIRKLCTGIFSALHDTIRCACTSSHNLGLVIATRKPVLLPGDDEEEAARALHFDVVLGTYTEKSQIWDRIRVKLAEKEVSPPLQISSPKQSKSPRNRAGWASLSIWPKETGPNPSPPEATVSKTASKRSHITDLCQALRKGKCVSDCYGCIDFSSNKFDLYHQDCPSTSCSTMTLREILEDNDKEIANFGYPQRLRLALTVSFGVLHLYNTPWLAKVVRLDDIVFLREEDTLGHHTCNLDRPFLARQVCQALQQTHATPLASGPSPLSTNQQPTAVNTRRPADFMILSLGLLLIQVIIGKHLAWLHVEDMMDMDCMVKKQTLASEMVDLVIQDGGTNYKEAVQWCLSDLFSVGNLDHEELAGQFYDAVISKLETDMKFQTMLFS